MPQSLAMLIGSTKPFYRSPQDAQDLTCPSCNNAGPAIAMENSHDMDSSLWSRLPEDLIERVLARLPAANLLRLRTVCREWSQIMTTKSFLDACSQVASYEPYFVKFYNRECNRTLLSFDPSENTWRRLPFGYLLAAVGYWPVPVSSSSGLVCFINKHSDGQVLFVSNPLTKTCKQLPRLLCKQGSMLVSIIMWKQPSHYKVIVVGENGSTELFDSMEGEWRNIGSLPHGETGSLNVAFCNGSLYCLTPHRFNCALLALNIHDEVWSKVKTRDLLPGKRQFRNLVMCKGHLVIVSKATRSQVLFVCVWRLEWKTMEWREAGRMPEHNLMGRPSEGFHCCSHGDLIFLTSGKGNIGFLFDLAQKMWRRVDAKPYLLDGFTFEPRFDSHV